jgi:hypothetical protein
MTKPASQMKLNSSLLFGRGLARQSHVFVDFVRPFVRPVRNDLAKFTPKHLSRAEGSFLL